MSQSLRTETVKLLAFHDGENGHLNDNSLFIENLHSYRDSSKGEYRAEEHFNNWVEIYKRKDRWGMYFTDPKDGEKGEVVHGYLIESENFMDVWSYYANISRTDIKGGYIQELINDTVNYYANVSTENLE